MIGRNDRTDRWSDAVVVGNLIFLSGFDELNQAWDALGVKGSRAGGQSRLTQPNPAVGMTAIATK